MDKRDLSEAVAARTGLSRNAAKQVVDAVTDAVSNGLARGEDVRVTGFGTFGTSQRPSTRGRDPRTGAAITLPAATTVRFRSGKGLKEKLNGS